MFLESFQSDNSGVSYSPWKFTRIYVRLFYNLQGRALLSYRRAYSRDLSFTCTSYCLHKRPGSRYMLVKNIGLHTIILYCLLTVYTRARSRRRIWILYVMIHINRCSCSSTFRHFTIMQLCPFGLI